MWLQQSVLPRQHLIEGMHYDITHVPVLIFQGSMDAILDRSSDLLQPALSEIRDNEHLLLT